MRHYALTILASALMPAWIFVEWLRGSVSNAAVIAVTLTVAILWLPYLALWLIKPMRRRRLQG